MLDTVRLYRLAGIPGRRHQQRYYGGFMVTRLLTAGLLATFTVFGPLGCASKGSVLKVRDEARDAHRIAEQALTTAQEANNRSIRTEEMVDRSFRHSMRK
jgi:hypothetical protein